MSRRSSCQKMIMIAYFGLQNGCLPTKRREKEKQRRTRAAKQRESSGRCASQKIPRCRSGGPKSAMELTDSEPRRNILRYARLFPPGPQRNQHRQVALLFRALFKNKAWL